MSGRCKHCGGTQIDRDPSRGDAVCMQCGSILEESMIISEVQYAQDCSGATRAIGQLVSAEGSIPSGFNLGHSYGLGKESRAITLQNARRKISNLASQLKLPERCVDIAHNFYKMALTKKLTQGRKNPHVIAACVYMVCRKEETPHMLLDLSDILQVNVYELGKTYLKLSTALCINTPAIDPSLYILRFAHQLDFGDKTHEVSVTASRLVQRMKRDWMHTGRRPSGLCGAALLVAARLHNFCRSVDDVIKVVRVCQATVRKRLSEFSDTPSSRLTLDEFMTIDLEEEQDPPAFKAARKKKLLELEEGDKVNEATKQISEFQDIIDKALEEARQKKFARFSKLTKGDTSIADQFIADDAMQTINKVLDNVQDMTICSRTPELSKLLSPVGSTLSDSGVGSEISNMSLDISKDVSFCSTDAQMQDEEFGNFDFLTGLDEAEIDSYIMDDDETKSKTEFWMKSNEDYLQEQKVKEEKRLKEAESASKEQKKKRKRQPRPKIQANTAEEAIEKMLQQKKISLKLDYSVLQNLNSETPVDKEEIVSVAETEVESEPVKKKARKSKRKSKAQLSLPPTIKQGIIDIVDNARNAAKLAINTSKEQKPDIKEPSLPPAQTEVSTLEPVIDLEVEEGEEDDYEEEEEDDGDHNLSAAQLLHQKRGDEESEYADFDYDEEYEDFT